MLYPANCAGKRKDSHSEAKVQEYIVSSMAQHRHFLLSSANCLHRTDKMTNFVDKDANASVFPMQSVTYRIYRTIVLALALAFAPIAVAQVNTEQVMRIGQNALYFEDYMLSIQYFNQAIQAKPYLAQPYFLRAIAKLNLEDYRGAEADATTALNINPFLSDAWEVRGVARQNTGKLRLAIDDYTEALKLLPRNRSLLFNKALALTGLDENDLARETFDEILRYYPRYANAYLGRARISLAEADTTAALADIDKALEIDANSVNAYIMRADIAIHSDGDYAKALTDIDKAIKLQPQSAGLYINRAFLRYKQDSYRGAMADYDYALTLEPYNMAALSNRGLLLLEVNANDRALEDFNRVLELEPDDVRALYNRAIVHSNKGNINEAIADITRVAEAYPELPTPYYMRGNLYRRQGKLAKAEADYKKGDRLTKALPRAADQEKEIAGTISAETHDREPAPNQAQNSNDKEVDAATSRRFASLITVDDNADFRQEYNNSAIRGRIQDKNISIEIEPPMLLSFYSSPTELRSNTYYIREVDDLNATRSLRFVLVVTNHVPAIDETTAGRHFQSVEYYNSFLATHTPRPVDYIGRALDFITVRDYRNAEKDATRAIELAPDLALGYMVRAQANYGRYQLDETEGQDAVTRNAMQRKLLDDILADYDKVLQLSPSTAVIWYNKGNVLFEKEDYDEASRCYTRAVELKPDFGEAYYNRGYIMLKEGRRAEGISDLSKAGELGIVPAYNLIKRISQ